MSLKFDIFCKIVDNFGDIGFCWRLARQLHKEHGITLRLYVDNWPVASQLIPALRHEDGLELNVEGIQIIKWHDATDFSEAADVVLETFACGLPDAYLLAMQANQSKWVNVDYCSAEAWIDDFHAQPSPQSGTGLTKHFYFPGFTAKSGGLLREKTLDNKPLILPNVDGLTIDSLKVSLFSYPHAPVADLLDAMASSEQAVHCYVPDSIVLPAIAEYFGQKALTVGDRQTKRNLQVTVLPFLSVENYDALLHACDLNFVRGEDSWVRAIWAGKPFVWQPYFQTEETHIEKLDAFLSVYYGSDQAAIKGLHHAWCQPQLPDHVWHAYMAHFSEVQQVSRQRSQVQMKMPDMTTQLVAFCKGLFFAIGLS